MSAEHGEYEEKENTEPDNINVGLVSTITIVGAVLVVSIALALTALVRSEAKTHSEEVEAFADLGSVKRLKTEQIAKLEQSPSWADQSKGLVAIPLARAMDLVTADIQKNPALATKPNPADKPAVESPDGGADGGRASEGTGDEAAGEGAKPGEKAEPKDEKATPKGDKAEAKKKDEAGKKPKAPKGDKGAAPVAPAPAPAPVAPAPGGPEN